MSATIREREDLPSYVTHPEIVNPLALASLLNRVRETHRAREDMLRPEMRLTLQIKAIERRIKHAMEVQSAGGAIDAALAKEFAAASVLHLEAARDVLHKQKLLQERQLGKLAMQLPVWPWVESVRGFGAIGLGQIIAETGDLCRYPSPAKVWKRMGLAVIDGKRQRKVLDKDEAIVQAYTPRRRAIMHVIGDSLIKGNDEGTYRTTYLERKEYEREMHPEFADMVTHKRALRYMEKLLLKHLWQTWRDLSQPNTL